ncbi:MAG: hypothetical protein RJA10_1172 [Pseudomonadota bacterium]|jgi:peptide/nickel transport system substrate-binding protein
MPRRRALLGLGLAAPLRLHGAAPPERLGVVGPWEIAGLEPATSGYLFTRMQVTQTLVDCDDQGRLQPGVARHWQVSPDGLDWRFELHTGARFHDGQPIAADSVARGLQRAVQRPGPLSLAPWADIGTRGDALHIRLKAPFSPLPALLAHSSAMLLSPGSLDAAGRVARILGSGPYRITQLDAPQAFEVQATGVQAVQRAHYLSAARAETRALMAEAGQAHLAWGLDPASLQRLRRRPGLQVQAVTVPRVLLLKLDAAHPALADRRVRQALSLALDRDGIAAGLLRDPALAATQLFPPPLADWHQPDLPPLRHDAAAARALLAAAGWGLQRPLRLTLRTFPDRPELPVLAAAVQEQCRLVGVQVEVLIGNSGDVPLRHRDGSLQLALVARQLALVPDPLGVLLQDHGAHLQRPGARPGGDWGSMNWRHDDVDQALLTLPRIADEAARAPLRRQLARRLHEDLPVIPISWYRQNAAVSQRLSGFSIDPLERSYRLDALQWT